MLSVEERAQLARLRATAFGLVVAAYILSFFHRMAPASIAGELARAFSASGVELGGLAATYFYVYTAMQVPTGVLVDTLGVRAIVAGGGVIAGVGSLVFGTADTLGVAAAGRLLVGLGVSVMFVAMLKINAVWFHDRHFGTLTGLTVLLGNLGAVLAAAPLVWLLALATWREVFVAIGFFSLALGAATWFFVRNHPGEVGLPSPRELDGHAPHAPHRGRWTEGLAEVLRNRATWAGFWPSLGVGGTLFAFAGLWAVPYLEQVHGMTRAQAADHTALMLAGFAVGSFLLGALSDRLGRRRPVMLAGLVVYLACWLWLLAQVTVPRALSLALFAVMGFATAGFTLVWAVAKEVNRPALSGMATSVVNTGAFLGGALLQPLVGLVMDFGWDGRLEAGVRIYSAADYRAGMGLMTAFAGLGLIGALFVRETYCRYSASADKEEER